MALPLAEQLDLAVATAERMRLRDVDPHYVARVLLHLRQRNEHLEQLLIHVDRYLRFGMDEHELTALHRLVERLREERREAEPALGVDDLL